MFMLALWGGGIAFGSWILFSVFLARHAAKKWLHRFILVASMVGAPVAYVVWSNWSFNNGLEELAELNKRKFAGARDYLAQRCAKDRYVASFGVVDPSGGLLVLARKDGHLELPDAPPPESATKKMLRNQKRYGESYPESLNANQYKRALVWTRQGYPDAILKLTSFAFVEQHEAGQRESGFSSLRRGATGERVRERVQESGARYTLAIKDVSTVDDRNHWVARGEISLIDKASGQEMARYVGFAANAAPAYMARTSDPWERISICDGVEQRYVYGREKRFDVMQFFFKEVVHFQKSH